MYSIGEVATRSGFSASALRYYEGIGLVPPAGRTDAGYRRYDDATLARLAFIARAKQLGCTLDEVIDLVETCDGDLCAPVQRRFHELVTEKLAATRARVAELEAFAGQLRAAAVQLGREPVDGPCDPLCACFGCGDPDSAPVPVPGPVACTLGAGAVADRVGEWAAVLTSVVSRSEPATGGLRLDFGPDVDLADLARLVAAEQACCAFFAFALTIDERGVALEVRAPVDAEPLVTALFGAAA